MVGNLISSQKDFPKEITLNLENSLIKQIGFIAKDNKLTKQKKVYEDSIVEIKKVVLGAIAQGIKEPNKIQYNNEKEFNKVVELLKFDESKLKIEIVQELTSKLINPKKASEGKKPKDDLTLKISYTE